MLYDVFVESNQPLPPMGIKQWSAKLTPEQREIMHALPAATSDRESLISAMRTVVEAMRTAGRRAAVPCGCQWPGRLEDEVMRFFNEALDQPPSEDLPQPDA